MKKKVLASLLCLLLLATVVFTGCSGQSTEHHQYFERIIAGEDIAKYVPYGAEGLISQYEYVDHFYHEGDNKAYQTQYNTTMIFENEEYAQKRMTSLKRTYGDDVAISGCAIYINQLYVYSDYEMSYKNSEEEVRTNMLADGFIEIIKDK